MVMLGVPDMDSNSLQVQHITDTSDTEGRAVTVTFTEDAGIMNPMNGGMHSVKVHTSASSMPAEQMICQVDADSTYTALTDGDCTAIQTIKAVKLSILPTTPDIARVSLGNDVSGEYTGSMTVRFVTDADLSAAVAAVGGANPTPAVPAGTITLKLGEMMNGAYSGFGLPEADFFPPNSVLVNGHNVASPDVDSDNGVVKVAMPTNAAASDSVSVTFLAATGIMNPTLPVTDPATEMMDYPVMVKTSAEDDEYGSEMVTIMAAPEVVVPDPVPPAGVMVDIDPETANTPTRLTVRFTTGVGYGLDENDEITVTAPLFQLPNSIDSQDVTVNGANAKSVAVNMDTGEMILTLATAIPENRTVSVVFRTSAGIMTPKKGGPTTEVEVTVHTSKEMAPAPYKVGIMAAPKIEEPDAIQVVPPVPGEDSRITLKVRAPMQLSSIQSSEIIFRFHDDFSISGGRVDVSKVTIQADSIDGGEVDTPEASGVVHPTSATVTYETVDREPQIRLAVPDMADDEGNQHININAVVTVVFQQGSGIINPTEASSYGIKWAVNDDSALQSLGKVVLPTVVALSGDGGKRGTSVTAVAKGVEGGEAVLFWLDTATAKVQTDNGPDGVYDPDTEAVLCRATAESNDTATCVFEVQNPPFEPGQTAVGQRPGQRGSPRGTDACGRGRRRRP